MTTSTAPPVTAPPVTAPPVTGPVHGRIPHPSLPDFHPIADNSTLSISSPHISDCREVAEYLCQCNIPCHVTSNDTVVSTTNSSCNETYRIERGCQIKFGSHPPSLINPIFWTQLKRRFGLHCAHLHIEGKHKGCIYDYFRKSNCPHCC